LTSIIEAVGLFGTFSLEENEGHRVLSAAVDCFTFGGEPSLLPQSAFEGGRLDITDYLPVHLISIVAPITSPVRGASGSLGGVAKGLGAGTIEGGALQLSRLYLTAGAWDKGVIHGEGGVWISNRSASYGFLFPHIPASRCGKN
jgi:hypothetical protein